MKSYISQTQTDEWFRVMYADKTPMTNDNETNETFRWNLNRLRPRRRHVQVFLNVFVDVVVVVGL